MLLVLKRQSTIGRRWRDEKEEATSYEGLCLYVSQLCHNRGGMRLPHPSSRTRLSILRVLIGGSQRMQVMLKYVAPEASVYDTH